MQLKSKTKYYAEGNALVVEVISILSTTDKYWYAEINLWNKDHGYLYELCKNYKLYKHKIKHWKVLEESC